MSDPVEMQSIKEELLERAASEGFAAAGTTTPKSVPFLAERLDTFIGLNRHGEMNWLGERREWRGDPSALWPKAKSILMLADLYDGPSDLWSALEDQEHGVISAYALGRDYHDVVKKRLKRLGRWLVARSGAEIKVFVDTAPVMEKPLAAAAGLGWQGKHTNLVSRELGNWFFLGAIFTSLPLPADQSEADHCGSCRACLDVCPTNAFPAPYQLDARKCISYLTIEHKGPVAPALRKGLGNRIYGCDDCLAVCPWNKFAKAAHEIKYAPLPQAEKADLSKLAALDDAGFRSLFSGSPIKRIGRNRMVRNVAYAIGNSGNRDLLPSVERLSNDADPVVAEAAQWAIEQLQNNR